jgi:hypothetical protein
MNDSKRDCESHIEEVIYMLISKGKQITEAGTYWDTSSGERVTLQEKGMLPGDESTRYIKASSTTMLLIGPVLGLMFAIFLPFIGIAMTLSFLGKKVFNAGKRTVQELVSAGAKNIFFAWRPLQSYLAKRRSGGKKEKEKAEELK